MSFFLGERCQGNKKGGSWTDSIGPDVDWMHELGGDLAPIFNQTAFGQPILHSCRCSGAPGGDPWRMSGVPRVSLPFVFPSLVPSSVLLPLARQTSQSLYRSRHSFITYRIYLSTTLNTSNQLHRQHAFLRDCCFGRCPHLCRHGSVGYQRLPSERCPRWSDLHHHLQPQGPDPNSDHSPSGSFHQLEHRRYPRYVLIIRFLDCNC